MTVASQTFGLYRNVNHSGSFTAIGARLWLHVIAVVKARLAQAARARADRELQSLVSEYETVMPSLAAELRHVMSSK